MISFKNRSIAAAAALVATTASIVAVSPVRAETAVAVSYRDLDLGSKAGVDTLNSRIRHAATVACGHGAAPIEAARCREQAVSNARAQLALVSPDAGVRMAAR